ncbi:MAG: HlyD family efflux transporter periplasmic adaptor subunit [Woeseia sp.]
MAEPLYRPEAVNARFDSLHGRCVELPPPAQRLLTAVFGTLLLSVAALLIFGSYTARDTVRGYVTTTAGNVPVFAQRSGVVVEVLVQDGLSVAAGEPLLRVSVSRTTSVSKTDEVLLASLFEEKAVAAEQAERAGRLHTSAMALLREQLDNGVQEAGLLKQQLSVADQRLDILGRELVAHEAVAAKGHIATLDVERRRLQWLDDNLARAERERRLRALQAANKRLARELADLPLIFGQQVAERRIASEQLERRIVNATADTEFVVPAPIAGTVSGMLVRYGDTVSAQHALLSILPAKARYYVELLVPDRAIAFVNKGDAVRLRIDALPFQKFGVVEGVVSAVSSSLAMPADLRVPLVVREPVYLVKVQFVATHSALQRESPLLEAGMAVSADVLGETRQLIDWMLAPLEAAAGRIS